MGYFVIVTYQPRPGKERELENLIRDHLPVLRQEGLASGREPYVMRASGGAYVEVFEWKSKEAVESAHTSPAVLAMWEKFAAVSEFRTLGSLKESGDLFAHFEPVDF